MNYDEYWGYNPEENISEVTEVEDVENAREFLEQAVNGLYGDASLEQIERSLEEACAYLKVPFPNKELTITKKNPYFQFGVALSKHQARVLSRTIGE